MKILITVVFFLYLLECVFADDCTLANGVVIGEPVIGQLCAECNYRGIVSGEGKCRCNDSTMDPNDECATFHIATQTITMNRHTGIAECECYTDSISGFWGLSAVEDDFVYGKTRFPATCNRCATDYYGPIPSAVTASLVSLESTACTAIGGSDPNAPKIGIRSSALVSKWVVCAGHGRYISGRCLCDVGWGLREIPGGAYDGDSLYICDVCEGPWGPLTPMQQYNIEQSGSQPYCSVPYTPDPFYDGLLQECSGHGQWFDGACQCDSSNDLGYWRLATWEILLEGLEFDGSSYVQVQKLFSVETCIECQQDFVLIDGCSSNRTRSPTNYPTRAPTLFPTRDPTRNPTVNPTRNPTFNPTRNPTRNPTTNPTRSPSINPTRNPSVNPTRNPTVNPTRNPTINPTRYPSINPTRNPSRNPTVNPSRNPSISPSLNPSRNPTINPTRNPTINPTRNPSVNPTVNPTLNPSINPTRNPTRNPSRSPTTNPTRNPSRNPTRNPTLNPSRNPTRNPTQNPSRDPTKNPTGNPTRNPTLSPTGNPTRNPTKNPTRNPTRNPSRNPTKNPTRDPTRNPTTKPTEAPTRNPTKNPTKEPTANPTTNPTETCSDTCENSGCECVGCM